MKLHTPSLMTVLTALATIKGTATISSSLEIRDGAIWPADTTSRPAATSTNQPAQSSRQSSIVPSDGTLWPSEASGSGVVPATGVTNQPPVIAANQPVALQSFIRATPMDGAYRRNILVEWQTDRNPFTTLGDRVVMVHDSAPEEDIETKTVLLRFGDTTFRATDPGTNRFYYVQPLNDRVLTSNPVIVRPFIPDLSLVRNATNAGTTVVIAGDSVALGDTNGVSLASLIAPKMNLRVVASGKAGDTSRSLLARLDTDVLAHNPKVVVLIIGGNDERIFAGAAVSRDESLANIRAVIDKTHAKGASVLFLGTADFEPILALQYRAIASDTRIAYVPDVMEDLWLDPRYMRDALHPNARGYARIERRVGPAIRALAGTSLGQSVIPIPVGGQDFAFTWTMTASRLGINIAWDAVAGRWYRIVSTEDLNRSPTLWKTIFRAKAETSSSLSVTVRIGGQPMQFLRLMEE